MNIQGSRIGDRLRGALRRRLVSAYLPLQLAVLAIVLTLPALGVGWQMDDHFQRLAMLGRDEVEVEGMEVFSVLNGDVELNRRFIELGYLPWWTREDFRLAFFRPLSLATTRLDYRLWPDSPVWMHAHSLLWLAALVAAVAMLYRRLMEPAWVGGLAALLYAVDEAHAPPAAWLANRNALVAGVFGVLCLVAHDRWRRDGWRLGVWAAPALLALGLLAGEVALGAVAYLVAYALILERPGERLRSFAAYGLVLGGWVAIYRVGGFGAWGSGLYIEPLRAPVAFAAALVERAPFLLMGQWTPLPADLGGLLQPAGRRLWWWVAVGLVVVIAVALRGLLRRDRRARFWALGMALSLVPVAATSASNRLLFFAGIGAMGLMALFLEWALGATKAAGSPPAGRLRRGLGWFFIGSHLVVAPMLMPMGAHSVKTFGEPMVASAGSLGSDPRISEQDLIVVGVPDYLLYVTNIPTLQALAGRPMPRRLRALSAGPTGITLSRLDDRTLRVELDRGLFSGALGLLFHDPRYALTAGSRTELDGFEVEIVAVAEDGSPSVISYRFATSLEDPSLRWVSWEKGGFVPFAPPAVGRSLSLPPPIGPFDELGWSR